ncbi:leucine--tRNA ligase [Candidatus Poseidonia alphae]|uniref:leucine--tRNA ligase n=1 Tax=Candidatus Poseidonia alphae TaxID=1915863 RepID=UPI00231A4738|nr:leucine--tRNA ligase [Candidatus Poseidonia alphae]MDA8749333.1 leucine--tRNA ligase [Candidatus Poseidonia alphae]MDA8758603.1 leucine--tRNA ligase [Candidatus Poseidonia alphae]MDB2568916.1 leucine--tRNA ligase [Candidatus Poseidonia alphae]
MSSEMLPVDEVAWQKKWADADLFKADITGEKPKFYCLEMYPYPSGKMHMGHVRNYSIGDAVARYKRMMGFEVLYPMGFDSFGMPAENAAMSEGGHPHDITERNMASITQQIKRMGFSYDWSRTLKSHDPRYYKWNQWFFTKFFESGLAKREFAPVNWCESCNTVLANEQVKAGRCWRCNGPVEQKGMSQWFIDLPSYAQELLDGLDSIKFPDHVKSLQRDWLGRSEGADITFQVVDSDLTFEVFTTRPDTLFGATFVTFAPEHPLSQQLVEGSEHEADWKILHDEVVNMSEFDRIKNMNKKKGVFSGRFAIHPLTGEEVPIWFGNFVIATYGTGAVMAVPGHDERDHDFAKVFEIPIKRVLVMNEGGDSEAPIDAAEVDDGWMVNSGLEGFDGLYGQDARNAICEALESKNMGLRRVNWKIRPWLVSRQRYWGTPIPIIHCDACGAVPVPEQDLPVELPRDVVFGQGNPLETSKSFIHAPCPTCGVQARRETDTMDTFMDSSWYFLRYTDALNDDVCFEKSLADQWMMVDFYCGGIEHAQMHLIYARFMTKALRDLGLTSVDEPFKELLCQGMVNKSAPYCASCSVTHTVDLAGSPCPHCNQPLTERSAKMSKSTGNTVSPEAMIELYGADTVRLFILFAANPTAGMDWSDAALEANHRVMLQLQAMPEQLSEWKGEASSMDAWLVARFKKRVHEFIDAMDTYDLRRAVELSHYEIIKDINWYVRRGGGNSEVAAEILPQWAQMISVSTPHIAEEWWAGLQRSESFAANSHLQSPVPVSDDEHLILAGEQYIRDFLEQARKVQNIAERHLGGPAKSATVVLSPSWKREMARSALEFISEGGHPKQFVPILAQMAMAQGERKGEMIGFWGKKMLPQVFKWDDESRQVILSSLDEKNVLEAASAFIASDLGLESVVVVEGESEDDNTERAGSAMPLSPAIVYA